MSATAIRAGRVPDHRDDDGHNRYAVKTDQYGRIKPFDTYALQAWYEEERNAPLWAAQQFCVYVIDNELGTCPLRDKLNLFYVDVQAAFKARSSADKMDINARYESLVNEYNSTISTSDTSGQRVAPVATDSTDRPVAEPAPTPAPVASPEPDVTVHRTPEPAPEPTRVATDEPQRVAQQGDTMTPEQRHQELMDAIGGIRGTVNKHDTTLYGEDGQSGLVKDVEDLKQHCFGTARQGQHEDHPLDRFEQDGSRRPREEKSRSRWDWGRVIRPYRHHH